MRKKCKAYKSVQYVSFVLSVLFCLVPTIFAAVKMSHKVNTTESKWALGGIAIFIAATIVLVVLRSIIRKYISKLPYSLTVLVSVGSMFLLTICLEHIITDAKTILFISMMGTAIGLMFELVSIYCKAMAQAIKDERDWRMS